MTEKDLAEDYRMVLHEAKSMGCNEIKALYNIPLKNMEMIVQALEKQIPKKPIIKHINTSEEATEIEYTCSVCGTNFVELTPCMEWCPYCGNKIYWSDEE